MTDANPNPTEVAVDDTVEETVVDQPSEEKETPSTEPQMITREEAEKLANERHSKLDKRIAELEKTITQSGNITKTTQNTINKLQQRVAAEQKRADEAERRALGDTPEPTDLSRFEEKLALRHQREELDRLQAEFEEQRATDEAERNEWKADKARRQAESVATELAKEHGVDATLLVALTDGSREKMEALAKVLPKKEPGDNIPNVGKPPKPDSGKRSGGSTSSKNLSVEQRDKMSHEDYFTMREREEKEKK